MTRPRVVTLLVAVLLLIGGASAIAAPNPGATVAAKLSPVSCDYTASKLTCTVPQTTVTKTVTSTVTVTATPTSSTTVPTTTTTSTTVPTSTTTTTSTPPPTTSSTTTPPPATGFPTASTTGVPAGWVPTQTINGNYTVSTAGATVQDLRINGSLIINASNVTVRRVEVIGGGIRNYTGSTCRTGLVIEDTSIIKGSVSTTTNTQAALETGGYTARRVKIQDLPEGFRVGGKSSCGPVTIIDSWARARYPDSCGDWHGDALQGYDGGALTLRNTYLELVERSGCGATAPFFYPSGQGNTSVDIDGLIVKGGGFSFRLGMPGSVLNLNIVDGEWGYGSIDVRCSVLTAWTASIVTLDANSQPVVVRGQACTTETGG